MKIHLLIIAFIFSLFSCDQSSDKKNLPIETSKKVLITKELWTLYAKDDTIFHIKRLLTSDSGFVLLSYDVNTSKPEAASQHYIDSKIFKRNSQADSIKLQSSGFDWIPYKSSLTLFVQIQPSAFKNEMDALNQRQEIEQKIETLLKSEKIGEWTGGDLGPGGANMLFEVSNFESAMSIIIETLTQANLNDKVIVGRRINTKAKDWFYEVIYPGTFNGVFLTM